MKKSTKILIATAMILGVSGGVFAFGKHNHWGISPEDKAEFVCERITKKLNLNELQQQNLQALVGEAMDLMREMRAEKAANKAEVEALLTPQVFDQNKALQMIQTKTQRINDKAPAVVASLAVFIDSLDEDQRAKVQSFVANGMHHGHRHSDHGHERE